MNWQLLSLIMWLILFLLFFINFSMLFFPPSFQTLFLYVILISRIFHKPQELRKRLVERIIFGTCSSIEMRLWKLGVTKRKRIEDSFQMFHCRILKYLEQKKMSNKEVLKTHHTFWWTTEGGEISRFDTLLDTSAC